MKRLARWGLAILLLAVTTNALSLRIRAAEPVAAGPSPSGETAEKASRWNVLLLLSDDQRPDTIGALGNPRIETPNLDDLVRRGTVFTRATCGNPLCVTSRAELLSGLNCFRNGMLTAKRLRTDVTVWPEVMRRAGYHTWYVGKWHTSGRPSTRGYEEVDGLFASGKAPAQPQRDRHGQPVTGYVGWQFQTDDGRRMPEKGVGLTAQISAEFADAAIRFLRRRVDQPFFLHVNFTAPHDPLFLPPGFERRYTADQLPLPPNFLPQHPFDHGNLRGRDELLWPFPRTPADVRDELATYYAVISHMDQQIGRILETLRETGLSDKTLVIFASDQGLAIGSHGLRGKQNMYEHTINTPLVVCGPGIPADQRREASCYLRDLFPTVCQLTGIEPPAVDGRSLVPVLRGQQDQVYPFIVGYFADSQRMIRRGRWKLVWYPQAEREQLFDLERDPYEIDDLSERPEQQATRAELRSQLKRWLREQGDPLFAEAAKT
ncbi:MAG: sulfatase-like hydrolase/transferase [Candidatus Anammoximicrobium sp.]|nr:sulfatase-like hydrolase/transferase [Candidatus Anammoximicrobium sp.]